MDTSIQFCSAVASTIPEHIVFGRTSAMQSVREKLLRAALTDLPVLIHGESGTGKEVITRLMHAKSRRACGPFLKLNCAAVPSGLLESELFGYERGAFTGAQATRKGLVECSNGGTLFLDEIGELQFDLQAKFLHLMQDSHLTRIGGHELYPVDVRYICATNCRLDEEVELGSFRRDLFYRINVVSIWLPPLRERRLDVPELIAYFQQIYSEQYLRRPKPLPARVMTALREAEWPGNIRQLQNVVKNYVIFGSIEAISNELLRPSSAFAPPPIRNDIPLSLKSAAREAIRQTEREVLRNALEANNWNRRATAKALKISYRSLFYKMKNSGLPSKRVMGRA